eukprot:SAG31_NODE_4341_length_3339_cov_1.487346_3_plen_186_part_00
MLSSLRQKTSAWSGAGSIGTCQIHSAHEENVPTVAPSAQWFSSVTQAFCCCKHGLMAHFMLNRTSPSASISGIGGQTCKVERSDHSLFQGRKHAGALEGQKTYRNIGMAGRLHDALVAAIVRNAFFFAHRSVFQQHPLRIPRVWSVVGKRDWAAAGQIVRQLVQGALHKLRFHTVKNLKQRAQGQ